jgi:general stress protein 26
MEEPHDTELDRLLSWARARIAKRAACWLITEAEENGTHARVVVPIPGAADDGDWVVWILVRKGSRKAREIMLNNRVTIAGYEPSDLSYLALMGNAALIDERAALRQRWRDEWTVHFPGGAEDSQATFARIDVDGIELCAPGLSREPYGSHYTALTRRGGAADEWTVTSR